MQAEVQPPEKVCLLRLSAIGDTVAVREMYIDGLVGIANGDNPRIIESRLQGYFSH